MTLRQWTMFILLTVIWGASFLWIKLAVRESTPLVIVTIRLLLALLALVPFLIRQKPGFPRGARIWRVFAIQGLMSTAFPWILITWAELHIDSALATVLNGTVPLFTIVVAHLALHDDKMTVRRVAGLLLGFVGVVVLMQRDVSTGAVTVPAARATASGGGGGWVADHAHGLALGAMLLSSFFYAASNVYARAKLRGTPPIVQAFYTMLVADAFMWIATPAIEPFRIPALPITWAAIAWLGVLGAGLSYLMFYHLLHQIGPTRVAVVTYTIPIVGVTLGVLFLGERLDLLLGLGTVLIVSGVWGVNRK